MSSICIAKKCSVNNVDFLDFAVDEQDNLIVFDTFKEASVYLKTEVGEGEQLLEFIITTTDAQKDNPRIKELLSNSKMTKVSPIESQKSNEPQEIECTFLLDCNDFELVGNEVIFDRITNKNLIPVIAFIDAQKTDEIVQTPNLKLKGVYLSGLSNAFE